MAVYHLLTSEETLDTVRSRVALVTALAVEVALTLALPPRIAGVEPVLPALRWGVPSVTALVAAVVTASVMRRREDVHLFATFFLFTVLNNLLQIYGSHRMSVDIDFTAERRLDPELLYDAIGAIRAFMHTYAPDHWPD